MREFLSKEATVKDEFEEGLHANVIIKDVQRYEATPGVNAQNETYINQAHYDIYLENDTCKEVIKISASDKATHEEKFVAFLLGIKKQKNIPVINANELANYIIDNKVPFKIVKIPFETVDYTGKLVTRYSFRTSAKLIASLED